MTKFNVDDRPTMSLAQESIKKALNDADMTMQDIDAAVVSTVDTKMNEERLRHYPSLLSSITRRRIPIIRIPAVCGGGGAAFWSGLRLNYDNILVIGVDKVANAPTPLVTKEIMNASDNFWEQEEGLVFPAVNALVAQRHMQLFGTTHDDLSLVSFKNHQNGALNPNARFYGKRIPLETIRNAPMISTPFNLYDCSISVNGAASIIVSKDRTDVEVIGSGLATDYLAPFEREDLTDWEAVKNAALEAFKQAKVSPNDIDVAEVHDAFTILELTTYEEIGFCKKGESKNLIRDGITDLDGKLPVNPSGGLKAKGHPISPTGTAQIVEIVDQLRNKCGDRQVTNKRLGLAQNMGGAGGTSTVHIFKKR